MNLVDRAQKIIMQPQQEWYVIQQEPTPPAQLYPSYIIPLAAIGPIARIIGLLVFGASLLGPLTGLIPYAIVGSVLMFALDLGSVYVMALIIDGLAPSFAGHKNINQAFKVAAYCKTPAWLGGIFYLIPSLGFLGALLGLYSLYLLYLGLPVLMHTPPDKAIGYTVVVVIAAIVVAFIIFAIVGAVAGTMLVVSRGGI